MEIINKFDSTTFNFFESISCTILDWIFKIITFTGNGGVVWIIVAFAFMFKKENRKIGVAMILSLTVVAILNNLVLKEIFDRVRPFVADPSIELLIKIPSGSSFPSGHASSSFACAMAIFMFDKKWGIWASIYAFLMAISRVYLHVHYATDVLGGMIVGIIFAIIIVKLYSKIENKISNDLGLNEIREQKNELIQEFKKQKK